MGTKHKGPNGMTGLSLPFCYFSFLKLFPLIVHYFFTPQIRTTVLRTVSIPSLIIEGDDEFLFILRKVNRFYV
jgi:hypothetical protein